MNNEPIFDIIYNYKINCTSCRLSLIHPNNTGLLYRGNPLAKIAVISEAPGDYEMIKGQPLIGKSGKEAEKWFHYLELNSTKDLFITNIINCQPEKVQVIDGWEQREPDNKEIKACFPKCLSILQNMPNLEVILTLGMLAARTILGGNPTAKSHEGQWFESSLVPGKAIFCLLQPAYYLREPDPDKEGILKSFLDCFKREYLDMDKPIVDMALKVKNNREKEEFNLFSL